jgi:hypothetical protein
MDDDALRKAHIEFLRERLATLRGKFEERALKAQAFNIRAQNVDEWVGAIAEQIRNLGNSSLAEEFLNAYKETSRTIAATVQFVAIPFERELTAA